MNARGEGKAPLTTRLRLLEPTTLLIASPSTASLSTFTMSRQDKATTDRNARILRELVKQPDNKSCADCRRNGRSSVSPAMSFLSPSA